METPLVRLLPIGSSTAISWTMAISAHTCWLSTWAQAWPPAAVLEVNVACDWPAVNVLVGGAMLPFVAVKNALGNGKPVTPAGTAASELCVMSAVTVELFNAGIEFGTAVTPSTIHGSKSAPEPLTTPQPALPGPALHPHQLFSRFTGRLPGLSIAVVGEMMRLKWAVT